MRRPGLCLFLCVLLLPWAGCLGQDGDGIGEDGTPSEEEGSEGEDPLLRAATPGTDGDGRTVSLDVQEPRAPDPDADRLEVRSQTHELSREREVGPNPNGGARDVVLGNLTMGPRVDEIAASLTWAYEVNDWTLSVRGPVSGAFPTTELTATSTNGTLGHGRTLPCGTYTFIAHQVGFPSEAPDLPDTLTLDVHATVSGPDQAPSRADWTNRAGADLSEPTALPAGRTCLQLDHVGSSEIEVEGTRGPITVRGWEGPPTVVVDTAPERGRPLLAERGASQIQLQAADGEDPEGASAKVLVLTNGTLRPTLTPAQGEITLRGIEALDRTHIALPQGSIRVENVHAILDVRILAGNAPVHLDRVVADEIAARVDLEPEVVDEAPLFLVDAWSSTQGQGSAPITFEDVNVTRSLAFSAAQGNVTFERVRASVQDSYAGGLVQGALQIEDLLRLTAGWRLSMFADELRDPQTAERHPDHELVADLAIEPLDDTHVEILALGDVTLQVPTPGGGYGYDVEALAPNGTLTTGLEGASFEDEQHSVTENGQHRWTTVPVLRSALDPEEAGRGLEGEVASLHGSVAFESPET